MNAKGAFSRAISNVQESLTNVERTDDEIYELLNDAKLAYEAVITKHELFISHEDADEDEDEGDL